MQANEGIDMNRRIVGWLAAVAAPVLFAGVLAFAASPASARTVTCLSCAHVQNQYAFRGALASQAQRTAINTPIILWYEAPTTTDPGADLMVTSAGSVVSGAVNQSSVNWSAYNGDSVVRFKFAPFGNGQANTYVGLNGTKLALRNNNPNSVWQEFIEVPVTAAGIPNGSGPGHTGGVLNACGPANPVVLNSARHCLLIDVGQTQNPLDPLLVTDPLNAFTGSLVQQDVEHGIINQFGAYSTAQVWRFQP